MNKLYSCIYVVMRVVLVIAMMGFHVSHSMADTIPGAFDGPLGWRVGIETSAAFVPGTNSFLRGETPDGGRVWRSFSGAVHAGFSFNPRSREGMLYPGLYQGLGLDARSFCAKSMLGTPVSAYVYQGAPVVRFGDRLWLGYEWKFGAAFGWKHYDRETAGYNASVSTSVTARMGLGVKMCFRLSQCWTVGLGREADQFSNGNTSYPNGGVNTVGAVIGLTYVIEPQAGVGGMMDGAYLAEDCHDWFYDITVYGSWRKRGLIIDGEAQMCPGRFGVVGLQFSPMRRLNHVVAVGASLDLQYDESSGLASYWVEGTSGDEILFWRPPIYKQLSAGVSAHAELTMPLFAVNAGLGYDFLKPAGDKRFYQSLTLKTFLTKRLYINVGYRLGSFKEPQNLMVGLGFRIL